MRGIHCTCSIEKMKKKKTNVSIKLDSYLKSVNTQSGGSIRYGWLRSSAAVGRSSGLMAKHFRRKSSASSDNSTSSGTGGGCFDWYNLNMTATTSSPFHGRIPAHISSTTHPTLQISILELYPFFCVLITSGAIQKTVPCMAVKAPPSLSSVLFEIPKSEILHTPDISNKILSAFKSR